jgi:glycosyltransferase involved in cell wall biosynthesis
VKVLYHHRTHARDGQEIHVRALQEAFVAEGHQVREVALAPKGGKGSDSAAGRPRRGFGHAALRGLLSLPVPLREIAEYAYTPVGAAKLLAADRGFGATFLYERYAFGNAAGALVSRRIGIPLVLEVNSPLVDELSQTRGVVFARTARRVERSILTSAALVCTVSDELRDIVAGAGVPPARLLVVPNGVHLARYRHPVTREDRDRARAQLAPELSGSGEAAPVLVGFVGYFRRWHRLDLLIRALAECTACPLRLVLVGDGAPRGELRRLAQRVGVADSVYFVGARPPEQIPALLAAFDIGVLPAITPYASPLKLIEYMAAGLAIAAPNQPNIRALIPDRQSALLFSPGDPTGLSQALTELATDGDLRGRLGDSARATVEERQLTWRANARRVVEAVLKIRPRADPDTAGTDR